MPVMAGGGVQALGHVPWGGHSWGDHTGGGAADRGWATAPRLLHSCLRRACVPSPPPPIPPTASGNPLPIPGPCFLPPALSQLLPLCFSLAGPRRKVDVRCVHTPWAAGWVGALHWWGWAAAGMCFTWSLAPLVALPQLLSSPPIV